MSRFFSTRKIAGRATPRRTGRVLPSLLLLGVFFNPLGVDKAFCFTDVATYIHPTKTLMARIEVPSGDGPFPVLMAIHGGGFIFGDYTAFEPDFFTHYNDLGFAVISTEYRLHTEGGDHPEAIKDCMHNLHWLIDHADEYDFDTDFIVVQGSSAGSYLAMMVGLTAGLSEYQPDFGPYRGRTAEVHGVISSAAVYDWTVTHTASGNAYIGSHKDDPAASPVNRAGDSDCTSFLLLGGGEDEAWSLPATAQAMYDSLVAEEIYCELHIMEEQTHPALYNVSCSYCAWSFARIDWFLDTLVASRTGIDSERVPVLFRIISTAPNPFNPSMVIRYEIARAGRVSLSVYNPRGALVKRLYTGREDPGSYERTWDGSKAGGGRVASGVYFVRLATDQSTYSKKVLLMK